MPSIDLVIAVLRTLNYKYENFYGVRKHLDMAFSELSSHSDDKQIKRAVDNIDDDFFKASEFDKEFIKKELLSIVMKHLKGVR